MTSKRDENSALRDELGLAAWCWPFAAYWSGLHANGQDRPLLSDQMVGREFSYTVQPGDSLTAIGARFGVGSNVLASRNSLAPNARLKVAQELNIDNRHIVPQAIDDGIVINLPQRMLFFFKEGQALRAYPVGLGKQDWPTPSGRFKIAVKEENPVWDVPKSIQEEMRREGKDVQTCVPPGPDNPLGQTLARLEHRRLRHSWHHRAVEHLSIPNPWLHPPAPGRCRGNFLPRSSAARRCCCSIAGCCWRASARGFSSKCTAISTANKRASRKSCGNWSKVKISPRGLIGGSPTI